MSLGRRWWAISRWPTAARLTALTATVRWWAVRHAGHGIIVLPLRLHEGTTQGDLVASQERLRAFYGCARVEVLTDSNRGNRAAVVLHSSSTPPSRTYPETGSARLVPPRASEPLPIGLDSWGATVSIPLFDYENGASSILIGGVPGTGKTTALRVLLAGLAPTAVVLVVIDPAGGAEGTQWDRRLSAVVGSAEPTATIALLAEVLSIIERRGAALAAGARPGALLPVCLVCDELAELAAAGTAKQQDEARSMLRRIVALGRKANVACILATQRTTATSIDVTTRSLVAWRLALAHPSDRHGSEALLGPGHHEAAELRKSDRGAAYLTDGGPASLVRVFDMPASDVRRRAHAGQRMSLQDLSDWDEILLREYQERERREHCEPTPCAD